MKKIILFIMLLLTAAALAATEPGKENGRTEPGEKTGSAPDAGEENRQEQIRDGSWPKPFVPTDKISADSVVSFPADI